MILESLRKKIPEHAMYRIYTEEKMKYFMELTHQTPNIVELEVKLGEESIEYFIHQLAYEMQLVDMMTVWKPWEDKAAKPGEDLETMKKIYGQPYDKALMFAKNLAKTKKALLADEVAAPEEKK